MKLAVIPARGGSKRIPGKNVREFAGKPVIAWSIETAINTGIFDRVIVSTDDEEIARVSKIYGADVPFSRPTSLSDDYTGTNAVVKHAAEYCISEGMPVKHVCCIYATAPFIQSRYIREGYEKLIQSRKSFAFSVTTFPFPVQRALRLSEDGIVDAIWPENRDKRSQDLEESYHDAAQFYWGTVDAFRNEEAMYSDLSVGVRIPRHLVQDIDTPEDWTRAEYMFQAMVSSGEITL